MTIIDVASDNMIMADVHLQCRLRDQLDRRATPLRRSGSGRLVHESLRARRVGAWREWFFRIPLPSLI